MWWPPASGRRRRGCRASRARPSWASAWPTSPRAEMTKKRKVSWNCADVEGVLAGVTPAPCAPLQGTHAGSCPFPTDTVAVDQITVQQCSYSIAPAIYSEYPASCCTKC
ncbi:unnamed protein product [Triticum turgidum subsp. durum]|uniref:Uncharacterized protein n=1 Tax=Triticum turgidum subsp. durum TaxID=4567 RepID=A0A9R0SQI5_TRITD|nr:unnamed protein product [Triticum turgidum subsp. durum]